MKTILITNDDGYISKGFTDLRNALMGIARVIAIAPANEKSACGHGLSVSKALEIIKVEDDFYKLNDGSPTDCIYVGVREFFKDKKPDLIISGINIGSNMGEDTTYSGTVAGAMEGAIHDIPSIAISQFIDDNFGEDFKTANRDFSLALSFITHIASDILSNKIVIGHRKFLNINIPPLQVNECKGVKITQLGYRFFNGGISSFLSPRGHTFHYLGMNPFEYKERDNTNNPYFSDFNDIEIISDFEALNRGYISLTPMQLDSTSYEDIIYLNQYLK